MISIDDLRRKVALAEAKVDELDAVYKKFQYRWKRGYRTGNRRERAWDAYIKGVDQLAEARRELAKAEQP
jgi:hypothetical protein